MNTYDKAKLQKLIDKENGTRYSKNIPLGGFTLTFNNAFISFYFREIKGKTVVVITYIYVTNKNELLTLLGYCINMWSGYQVNMIYYREHRRKSNIIKLLRHLDLDVQDISYDSWKHKWTSTNGYDESDCIEAFTKHSQS